MTGVNDNLMAERDLRIKRALSDERAPTGPFRLGDVKCGKTFAGTPVEPLEA